MKESSRTFLSVLGIYLAGSWVVLQVVDVLKQNLGLPPWAFSLALTLLLIGLPVVAATAWLQERARGRAGPADDPGTAGASPARRRSAGLAGVFTWRNAALGGLVAMALWGVVATVALLQDRAPEGPGPDQGAGAGPVDGPGGHLVVRTSPAGVTVEVRTVESAAEGILSEAVRIGTAPIAGEPLPAGETLLELAGPDLVPLTLLVAVPEDDTVSIDAELVPDAPLLAGMVIVPAGPAPPGAGGMPVEAFLVDRHEVTNREYVEFMADEGYGTPSLWPDTMVVGGERLARPAALARLVDATGTPGPRTWSGSVYPSGRADHPVTGVSWYEARAFCLWKGKRLPSGPQWWRAALGSGDRPYPWGDDAETVRARARVEASGTVEVESLPLGVSPFGAFGMAGNVREWLRPDDETGPTAPSVGGSWQDPAYTLSIEWREDLPLGFSSDATGFRCARHAG